MAQDHSAEITMLLKAWGRGDVNALEQLTPAVYDHLRRLAHGYMRRERQGHTLQATALVNEVYLRLIDVKHLDWHDRAHFFAVSARIMRRILVDAARARASVKRGGGFARADHSAPLDLDQLAAAQTDHAEDVRSLDDALDGLARMDARRAQVVELRFFGGLSVEETAQVLSVSPETVMRDWKLARAWLARELRR
jgi:RNA polymerase sigma factor (TIGR02999 family)